MSFPRSQTRSIEPGLTLRAGCPRALGQPAAFILLALVLFLAAGALLPPVAWSVPQGSVTLGATASSERFTVLARSQEAAEDVLEQAEKGWARLAPRFTPPPARVVTLVVVEDSKEYERIQPAPMTRGFATFGGTHIYLRGDQVDQEVVTHELTHIMLGLVVRPGVEIPDWFNEGLAQHAAGADRFTFELVYQVSTGSMLTLQALGDVDALQDPNREIATLQGLAVVRFLVDEFGEEALWELVDNLRYARTFNQALMETYRHSDLELNAKWMAYAESNYSLVSSGLARTVGALALGALALLALLVWLGRRSHRLYGPGEPALEQAEIDAAEREEAARRTWGDGSPD